MSKAFNVFQAKTPTQIELLPEDDCLVTAGHAAELRKKTILRTSQDLNMLRINDFVASSCIPVAAGDPVARHLEMVGLFGPVPSCVLHHPALEYFHKGRSLGTFPAMVAVVVDAEGHPLAVHSTYLTAQGFLAPVPEPRKVSRAVGALKGGCVPLHAPRDGVLGIALGIESAQAAWLDFDVPTVAACCPMNLADFVWPDGTQHLVVFSDNESSGLTSRHRLKRRAEKAGLTVDFVVPPKPDKDWCAVRANRLSMFKGTRMRTLVAKNLGAMLGSSIELAARLKVANGR